MIKVNLLKTDRARVDLEATSKGPTDQVRRQALVRFILLMLIPCAIYVYKTTLKDSKRSELQKIRLRSNAVKEEIAKYGDVAEVVKQHEQEKAKLNSQLNLIKELSAARELSLRLLDAIQNLLPKNAWLKSFEFGEGRISMAGMALDDSDVNGFVQAIEENILFSNVVLASSKADNFNGIGVKRFEVTCGVGKK